MTLLEVVSLPALAAGSFFYLAGTVGLLRFPDLHSRLHAVTKADNLGLGLIVAGLAIQSASAGIAAKLVLIWVLTLAAGATGANLIASHGRPDPPRERRRP